MPSAVETYGARCSAPEMRPGEVAQIEGFDGAGFGVRARQRLLPRPPPPKTVRSRSAKAPKAVFPIPATTTWRIERAAGLYTIAWRAKFASTPPGWSGVRLTEAMQALAVRPG